MQNYSKHTDEDLLNFIQQDNHDAFTEVYNRYWKELYISALRHLKVESLAEEAVQEVFISFYLNNKSVIVKDSLRGYLYTLVKRRVLNEIRSAIVRNNYKESLGIAEKMSDENPLTSLEVSELQLMLDKIISKLPEKCQEAYRLSRDNNLSHKSVAEKMGISTSTVEKHIVKALKVLKQNVNHYYIFVLFLTKFLF